MNTLQQRAVNVLERLRSQLQLVIDQAQREETNKREVVTLLRFLQDELQLEIDGLAGLPSVEAGLLQVEGPELDFEAAPPAEGG
jgi:hypothetical protein